MAYRGKSLKALRESKRIRLRRISNETRINMAYLEDLEDERFDRFPGKFYFESFTKQYARSLGLDPTEVLPASALGKTDPGVLAMNDPWTEHDREHVITGGTKGAVSCCGV